MTNPLAELGRMGQSIYKDRPPTGRAQAPGQLAALAEHGIDLDGATCELEDEGVQKFADSYRKAIASIEPRLLSS